MTLTPLPRQSWQTADLPDLLPDPLHLPQITLRVRDRRLVVPCMN